MLFSPRGAVRRKAVSLHLHTRVLSLAWTGRHSLRIHLRLQHSQRSTRFWKHSGIPPLAVSDFFFFFFSRSSSDFSRLLIRTGLRSPGMRVTCSTPHTQHLPVGQCPDQMPLSLSQVGSPHPQPPGSVAHRSSPRGCTSEGHGAQRLTWHGGSRRGEEALPAPGATRAERDAERGAQRSGSRFPAAVARPSAAPRPAPPPLWAAGRAPLSISGAGARPRLAARRR